MSKLRAILLVALILCAGTTMAACSTFGCGCPCNPCGEGPK
jgi:hypothetical protein